MSFSLTPQEQNRVKLAEALGYHLDPISHKDLVLIVVIFSVYAFDVLAAIYLIANRRYAPLKAKSPVLMVFALVSSICWAIGDLEINGNVHLRGTVMANCKGIGVWVRVLLGVCTVSSLIALRSYGLYRVFHQNLSYRGLGFYLPFLVYCGCTLVYGIVAQVLKPEVTVQYIAMLDICYCPTPFRASLFAYIWATWLFVAFVNWKIRKIKSSFNESREMAFSCFVVFAILTFTTALQFANPSYPFNQTQRILTTALDHVATNLVWWSILGVPMYNCLFHKQRYLETWKRKLREDGLQREYEVDSASAQSPTMVTFADARRRDTFMYNDMSNADFIYPARADDAELLKLTSIQRPDQTAAVARNGNLYLHDNKTKVSLSPLPQTKRFTADPFDIPPASPTTAVNSPTTNDPFTMLGDYYPLASRGAGGGNDTEVMPYEPQAELPQNESLESHVDYLGPVDEEEALRWPARGSIDDNDDDDDEYGHNRRRLI